MIITLVIVFNNYNISYCNSSNDWFLVSDKMECEDKSQVGISLYRFEPDDCDRIEQLYDPKLYISDPEAFNDPLDFRLILKNSVYNSFDENKFKDLIKFIKEKEIIDDYYIFDDEVNKEIIEWYEGRSPNLEFIEDTIKNRILSFGVRCFSRDYNNTLSWSHYSKSHKGFCIEYNFRPMDFVTKNGTEWAYYHVSYTNKLPNVCISEVLLTPKQAMEKLFATKTIEWAYEQEIRIVNFKEKGKSLPMPKGFEIKSLIAGASMCKKNLTLLIEAASELKIPIYQMKRNIKEEFEPPWLREKIGK